jgi:multidrug resistance efflux pump
MLEFLLCSLVTVLPDYLLRRFLQGKRWGHEITFFTMWYELRWGISACLILTVALITMIFYYHPSTVHASPFFRTVTILPENGGRVDEVFARNGQRVEAGQPLFSIQDSVQFAAVEIARGKVVEAEAAFSVARSQLDASDGLVEQAEGSLNLSRTELKRVMDLERINPDVVPRAERDRLQNRVDTLEGALDATRANREAVRAQVETVLPSRLASAREELERAEAELGKTVVYAGVTGELRQFLLQPGDYVNPILRPAGLLIPLAGHESGRQRVQAGFNQLAAQVIKPGTLAEISCLSKPFTVIPMVVVELQPVIAAGQMRPTDLLVDAQDRARPGTITVIMEPLYESGLEGVVPGTKCIANAYTYNHDLIANGDLGFGRKTYLHMVDAVGIVHAVILRIQTLMLPVKLLVFSGH